MNNRTNSYQKGYNQYRNGDSGNGRRYYQNRDQSQRAVGQERRVANNGGRQPYKNNYNPQMPGFPVHKNQPPVPKPFEPSQASKDGSGDKPNDINEEKVSDMTKKLSDIDINANETKDEIKVTDTNTEQSVPVSQSNGNGSTVSPKETEAKIETKIVTNSVSSAHTLTSTPNIYRNRSNTVGEPLSGRKPFIKNFGYGQKSYQNQGYNKFNNYNKYEVNRNNVKAKPRAYPPPSQSADLVPQIAPINPCLYNVPDGYYQHYFIPNPLCPSVGYTLPPAIPANVNDSAPVQKNTDNDTKGKMDSMTPNEPFPTPCFVPFYPSTAFPEPPHYYGHIVTYKTDAGVFPYFICDTPNNISPLQLQVNAEGMPVLPINCHLYSVHCPYPPTVLNI